MMYINGYGLLKVEDYFSEEISEQTIELVD